jgi:hypothetical protein
MVQRSKQRPARPRVTLHELGVLLETQNGQFRGFGEALQVVDAHVQSVDARLQSFREEVDARFDKVDGRLDRVEHDVVLLKDAVVENTRELKHLRTAVDKKVDRDEVESIVEGVLRRRG